MSIVSKNESIVPLHTGGRYCKVGLTLAVPKKLRPGFLVLTSPCHLKPKGGLRKKNFVKKRKATIHRELNDDEAGNNNSANSQKHEEEETL